MKQHDFTVIKTSELEALKEEHQRRVDKYEDLIKYSRVEEIEAENKALKSMIQKLEAEISRLVK